VNLHKFAPLTKIEEQSDGTLLVHSLITAQQPDLDKEVCDYVTTKALYEQRGAENLAKTSVPGMIPSCMPIREMHQLKAIGAGRSIEYDDAKKTIHGLTHIVEPTAVLKFRSGVLIGFSQGGEYVKKWEDPDFPGCVRYTADPMEWSAVDAPCLPSALVDSMKGKTVTLTKVDGATEEVAFEIPEHDELRMQKLENAIYYLSEVYKRDFSHEQREHDAGTGAALPDGSFPIENEGDLRNAIHAYGRAKDKEKAKAHIEARAKALGLSHLLPEGWKIASVSISVEEEFTMAKLTDLDSLKKAAKTLHDHLEKHMEMHKAHHEKLEGVLAKDHPAMKSSQAMMDHCEKCMKACKDAMEGEEAEKEEKNAAQPDLAKTVADAVTAAVKPFSDKVEALEKKMATTPAVQDLPHTGADAANKVVNIDAAFGELLAAK
jgi:hypothetical protein